MQVTHRLIFQGLVSKYLSIDLQDYTITSHQFRHVLTFSSRCVFCSGRELIFTLTVLFGRAQAI